MGQYLNGTGAGDYDLPVMTGVNLIESKRRNVPTYSIQHKTKLSWFPNRKANFQGLCSPPSTKYANQCDSLIFKNIKYSVGTKKRFEIPNETRVLGEQVPVQY